MRANILVREGKRQAGHDLLIGFESGMEFDKHILACLEGWPAADHDRRIQEMEVSAMALRDPEQGYWTASWLAYCGGPRPALRLLRRAVRGNYCSTEILEVDPYLVSLRDDPEYVSEFREIVAEAKACQERFLAQTGGV